MIAVAVKNAGINEHRRSDRPHGFLLLCWATQRTGFLSPLWDRRKWTAASKITPVWDSRPPGFPGVLSALQCVIPMWRREKHSDSGAKGVSLAGYKELTARWQHLDKSGSSVVMPLQKCGGKLKKPKQRFWSGFSALGSQDGTPQERWIVKRNFTAHPPFRWLGFVKTALC